MIHCGDCLEILRTLPTESVNCCVTSPPYYGLRDYGVSGQIGLEQSPDEYISKLVAVFREVKRVLRADGTLWLNLGMSYAGGGGFCPTAPSTKASKSGKYGSTGALIKGRVFGDKLASRSLLLQRVPAYGNDGKELQGFQSTGCVYRGHDDGHQGGIQNHRDYTVHNGRFDEQSGQPPYKTSHDTGHLDCGQELPCVSLHAAPASKQTASSGESFPCGSIRSLGFDGQQESQTLPSCVQASDHKSACTSGTSQMLPPLAVHTVGKESFFSACGSPDCKGIGRCGLCWVNLTIPSLNVKAKDELNIPHLVAMALQADGWILRQTICWHKPNPMPESVKDRCTKAHEYVFLLSKSARYFYDCEAVREPIKQTSGLNFRARARTANGALGGDNKHHMESRVFTGVKGANRRSVWTIPTKPYKGAHFATFPPALVEPCILAGCPAGGTVIDPFFGSGTVGAVAVKHGRDFVGIELNPEYIALAEKRIRATQPPLMMAL